MATLPTTASLNFSFDTTTNDLNYIGLPAGWYTDNQNNKVEVGKQSFYGLSGNNSVTGNNKVVELESWGGAAANLYTYINAEAGKYVVIDFDYSARANRTSGVDSAIQVIVDGKVVAVINGSSVGWEHQQIAVLGTGQAMRVEFKAVDSNGEGGVLDNIAITQQASIPAVVAPTQASINFEGIMTTGAGYQYVAAPTGWHTNNADGKIAVVNPVAFGLTTTSTAIDLEKTYGQESNLYTYINSESGKFVNIQLDYSSRPYLTSNQNSAIQVLVNGKVVGTLNSTTAGFNTYKFSVLGDGQPMRIEFKAIDKNGQGGLLDNIQVTQSTTAAVASNLVQTVPAMATTASLNFEYDNTNLSFVKAPSGWYTDNQTGNIEIGKQSVYGLSGINSSNGDNKVVELEANGCETGNLYTYINSQAGKYVVIDFDYSAREYATSGIDSAIQVIVDGKVVGVVNNSNVGFEHQTFSVLGTGQAMRVEFKSLDNNSVGGLLDNIAITQQASIPAVVAPTQASINFEGIMTTGAGYQYVAAPTGWHTNNADGKIAVVNPVAFGLTTTSTAIDLEKTYGQESNLYTYINSESGKFVNIQLNYSSRPGLTSNQNSAVQVLVNGQVVGTLNSTTAGFNTYKFSVLGDGQPMRIEFKAIDKNGQGGLLDNIQVTQSTTASVASNLVQTVPAMATTASLNFQYDTSNNDLNYVKPAAGWYTDNQDGNIEVGKQSFYFGTGYNTTAGNNKVVELESFGGATANLYTYINSEDGKNVTIKFDYSARPGSIGNNWSAVQVIVDGKVIGVVNTDRVGWEAQTFTVAGTGNAMRVEFKAVESGGAGGIIDNITINQVPQVPLVIADMTSATDTGIINNDDITQNNIPSFAVTNPNGFNVNLYVDGVKVISTYNPTTGTVTPVNPIAEGNHNITYTLESNGFESAQSPKLAIKVDLNDVAIVSSEQKAVTEADTASALNTSGKLNIIDPDLGEAKFQPKSASGTYGNFAVDANGNWTYVGNDAHNELNANQQVTETFTVLSLDGTATATVKVVITGTNDVARVTSESKSVTETNVASSLNTSGKLNVSDADNNEAFVIPQTNISSTYGNFSIDANGNWTFIGNSAHNELAANQQVKETFIVSSKDSSATGKVEITITGTNDAPVISSSTQAGTVQEDGPLTASGQVTATDVDHDAVLAYSINSTTGNYGNISLNNATGAWVYSLTDDQSLSANDQFTETFTVTVTDDQNATVTQVITITVKGTNDAPVISSSTQAGTVQEDGPLTASGQVTATDVDHDAVLAYSINSTTGNYGNISLNNATGAWVYSLTDDQSLSANDQFTETFTVTVTDDQNATVTQVITITVKGTNDAPVISSSTQAGTVQEDGPLTASGQVTATDVDHDAVLAYSINSTTGNYGNISLNNATGAWVYSLTDDQSLSANDQFTETFTVTVTDDQNATVTQVITITVKGTNDAPVISSSTQAGTVQEDGPLTASGQVTATDVDHDAVLAYSINSTTGNYGNISLNNATGAWVYSLTDDQSLSANDQFTETFTVTVTDDQNATVTQVITITVKGTNDAPVISSSTQAGTVQEDGPLTASGQVTATDVDHDAVLAYSINSTTGNYGNISLNNATGAWVYSLTDDQSLSANDQFTETFTVTVTDDQNATVTQVITITVKGTNDAPVISSSTQAGTVQEDGPLTASGQVTATDVDHDAVLAYSINSTTGNYGNISLNNATGAWVYSLTDDQSLSANDQFTETFTVTVTDDQNATVTQVITITVKGTNDAPVISSSTQAGTVQEDGPLTASGQVTATDVDHDAVLAYSINSTTGNYGNISLNNATGAWVYSLTDDQSLSANDQFTETFTVTVTDDQNATVTQVITITVKGTNDAPVISSSTQAGTVQEDGPLTASGQVTATDVDHDAVLAYSINSTTGNYGNISLNNATGAWVYSLTDDQSLSANDQFTETFTVTVTDDQNATVTQVITITVKGTNDAPVISSSTQAGTVQEDGPLTASGQVTATDVDHDAVLAYSINSTTGNYGNISLNNATGAWVYSLTDDQSLSANDQFTETFTVTVTDDQNATVTQVITITVKGTNDAPVISSSTQAGTVQEDGPLTASGQVTATDVDHDAVLAYSINSTTGNYGNISLNNATGAWVYSLTDDQSLSANDQFTETFTVTVTDDQNATVTQVITITVKGTNDAPVISSSTQAGTVQEDGPLTASGQVTATDVDHDAVLAYSINSTTGNYGNISLNNATGAWVYSLTDDQSLSANDQFTETFTVTVTDDQNATVTQVITITVKGTNDAPVISSSTQAGTVQEDGPLTASGQVTATDVDHDAVLAYSINSTTGNYGNISLNNATGAWVYSLTDDQSLSANDQFTETFTVTVTDDQNATVTQVITITVKGTNDAPVISSSTQAGTVQEDGPLTASGQVTATDVDHDAVLAYSINSTTGNYGNISLNNATGAWVYSLTDDQSLSANDQFTETFTVTVTDDQNATVTQVITITVKGTNDAPVISSSTQAGTVQEDGPLTASGQVTATDVDHDAVLAYSINSTTGNYGNISLNNATGAWVYSLTDDQSLSANDQFTETFTVTVTDDQNATVTQVITITVKGTNDAPVISSSTQAGTVQEDGPLTASGQVTATDVDHDAVLAYSINSTTGNYGNISLNNATGAWVYSLTDDQSLSANDQFTETFTVTVTDDQNATVTQVITITVKGTNDAPVISSSTQAGTVQEDGPLTASGQVTATDVDHDAVLAYSINSTTGNYGNISLNNATGAWVYSLTDDQSLSANDQFTETFTVTVTDDQNATVTQVITITVKGTNDAPVISSSTQAGTVQEDGPLTASGQVTATDVDHDAVLAYSINSTTGNYGNISLNNATGAWVYSLTDDQSLSANDQFTETFTVTVTDDQNATVTQVITITVKGTNDAPVISSSTQAGTVQEDGPLTASGQVTATDVDHDAVLAYSINSTTGNYGNISLNNATGAWVYSLTDDQSLSANDQFTETFTVTVTDDQNATVTQVITITVKGTNDAPVISSSTQAGTVQEDGPLTASGQVTATDVDHDAVLAYSINSTTGNYGNISLNNATGAWVYSLTDDQSLSANDQFTETFTVTVTDDQNATVTQVITITVKGTNDAPVISSSTQAGTVQEDGPLTASGQVTATDVDHDAVLAYSINSTTGNYGNISLNNATGAWVYSLTDDQSLSANDQFTETFTVTVTDDQNATVTQVITITVKGTNDAPVISSSTQAGTVQEDGPLTASGQVTATDVDHDAVLAYSINSTTGNYGNISLNNATGAWVYSLTDDQSLSANDQFTETFTVTVTDDQNATVTQVITITVKGTNDAPVISSSTQAGTVQEDGPLTASGQVTATDVDHDAVLAYSINSTTGNYGNISLNNATGAWVYSLTDDQSLSANDQFTETFTVTVTDDQNATVTQVITITVKGTNDAPVISSSTQAGTVQEDGPLTASGQVTATDVDHDAVLAYSINSTTGNYGNISLNNATGAWVYSLTDDQSLSANDQFTETFTVTVTDDQNATVTQVITITVKGTNDAPVISSSTQAGTVQEDGPLTASGQVTATDVDHDAVLAYSINSTTGNYGNISLNNATGAWVYSLTDDQSLSANDQFTETFTVTVTDDQNATVTQVITITVKGTNDAPVISSSTQAGTVQEDGPLTASGQVTATDVDHDAVLAYSINSTTGNYGNISLNNATGAWVYSLTDDQSLSANDQFTETFTVTVTDDQNATVTQVITITVKGTNDAPVISSSITANVDENSAVSTVVYHAEATDVDAGDSVTWSLSGADANLLSIDSNGDVRLINAANYEAKTGYSFNVVATDTQNVSTAKAVTLAINDINEAPTASVVTLTAIAEDSGARLITQAELLANATDVDAATTLTATNLQINSGSGSLVNNNNGTWTYTPAANDDTSVSFTYTVTDGRLSASNTATLDITPVNDAPSLTGTKASLVAGTEDNAYIVSASSLLQGYSDVDGDTLSVTNLTASNGTVFDNGDGTYTITPKANLNGTVNLNYQVIDPSGAVATILNKMVELKVSGNGQYPQITAVGNSGEYVVTFQGGEDAGFYNFSVYVQKFNADGTTAGSLVQLDAPGNTTGTGGSTLPQVTAVGSSGEYVVTFTGTEETRYINSSSIYVQKFNADGTIAGSIVKLEAIGNTNGEDFGTQITAVGSSGEYVVTFSGQEAGNTDYSIYVQKFNANGTTAGSMVKLEASGNTTGGDVLSQVTAVGSNGDYVVTFDGAKAGNTQMSVYVQKFNADGTTAGSLVQLEATGNSTGNSSFSQVTAVGSRGEYVVTFFGTDSAANGGDASIYVQKFNADGTLAGSMVQLEAIGNTAGDEYSAQVTAVGSSGDYVVTFRGYGAGAGNGEASIYVQKFNADGTISGSMVQLQAIDITAGYNSNCQVTAVGSSGEYVVTFDGYGYEPGNNQSKVYVQKFNADGTLAGSMVKLEVVGDTAGPARDPQITAVGSSGEYIVTYFGHEPGKDYSVYVQKFAADGTLLSNTVTLGVDLAAVNDAPVNTLLASYTTNEDTTVKLTGLSLADVDATTGTITVNLAVESGTLTATTEGGVTVTGSGTSSLTLTGSLANINAYLGNATNQPSYTAASNINGAVSLTMTTNDGGNKGSGGVLTDVDSSTIDITPVNDAPALTGTKATLVAGIEDNSYTVSVVNLLAGYNDVEGDAISVSNLIASNGIVVNNGNGTYTIIPTANFNGTVTLNYIVNDGNGGTVAATQSYNLVAVNDAPTLTGTKATLAAGTEDTIYTVTEANLLAGYTDVDGDTLSVTNLTASNGTVVNNGNGSYTITPTDNFNGTMALNYTVSDGTVSLAETQTYRVLAVNDTPVASNDIASAAEARGTNNGIAGSNATGNVLTNDTDVETASTSFVVTSVRTGLTEGAGTAGSLGNTLIGTYGSLTLSADGAYTYVVNNSNSLVNALKVGQTLTDSFNYTMSDGSLTDTAVLNVTINGENDAPTVYAVTKTLYDSQDFIGLYANVLNGYGVYTTPNSASADVGTVSFLRELKIATAGTYKFTLAADDIGIVKVDGVEVMRHDSFFRSKVSDIQLAAGDHVIEFIVTNLDGGDGANPSAVALTIANSAGTIVWDTKSNKLDTYLVAEDNSEYFTTSGQLQATDVDSAQTFTWSMANQTGTYGTMTVDQTGKWTYTLNNSASAVQALNTGEIKTDTFSVLVTDAEGASTIQNVEVRVAGKTDAPPALTGALATLVAGTEDNPYTVTLANLLQGYTDLDGDTLSVANLTTNNGTVVDNGGGTFTITPTANYNGPVTLSYNVIDGTGGSVAATQSFNLAAVNDAPVNTMLASYTTNEDASVKLAGLSLADVDVGSGVITVNLAVASGTLTAATADSVTATSSGTNSVTLTGTLADINAYLANATNQPTYTPEVNANGTVTLTMTTNDGGNTGSGGALTDVDASTINITSVNDALVITSGITASVDENSATSTVVYHAEATDVDAGDSVTWTLSGADANLLTIDSNGDVRLINSADYEAKAIYIFDVVATDTQNVSTAKAVTLAINDINEAPVAVADSNASDAVVEAGYLVTGDATATGNVLTNDTDVDAGDSKTVTTTGTFTGTYGSLVLDANGSYTYTLDNADTDTNALAQGQVVSEVFNYTMRDAAGLTSSATLTINITGTNDAPALTGTIATLPAGTEDNAYTVSASSLLQGYTDVEGDPLSVANLTASNGNVVDNADGTYTITQTANYNGTVNLTYQVVDTNGAVATIPNFMVQLEASGNTSGDDSSSQITAVGSSGDYVVTFWGQDSGNTDYSIYVQKFNADGTKAGSMVQLDGSANSAELDYEPQITALGSSGEYVVTFTGREAGGAASSIYVQKFNADGTLAGSMVKLEAIGNTSGYDAGPQITAVGNNGEYVVTFSGQDAGGNDDSIYVQKFNANGTTAGSMVKLEPIGNTIDMDTIPQVTAVGSSGDYVVTFKGQDAGDRDDSIYVQKFNADGTTAGSMVQLEASGNTIGQESFPQVTAVGSSGDYVVTFNGQDAGNADNSVYVQKFNANGTKAGSMVQLEASGNTTGQDARPDVTAVGSSGEYVVTFFGQDTGNTDYSIYIQKFNADGTKLGSMAQLEASGNSTGDDFKPDVTAVGSNGEYVVTFQGIDAGGNDYSIYVQKFNANGTTAGSMVQLEASGNTSADDQFPQVTAVGSTGEYVVTFYGVDDGGDSSIFVQKFNADGTTSGNTVKQSYTINAVNDAPVNTMLASYTTNEDASVKLAGLSVTDVDVGSGVITVDLAVASGALTAATADSVTATGSGTNSVTLTGTLADINAYLANATNQPTYTPEVNANGTVTLTMTTNDGGNTGSGGALTDVDASTINIASVNDAPALTGTIATLAAGTENASYTVTLVDLLQGYSDVDADTLSVTNLSADNGTVSNTGNGTFTITPTANFSGTVNLSYDVIDGNGGSVAATQSFSLVEANAAPALTGTKASLQAGTEDNTYTVSVADLLQGYTDADSDIISLTNLTTSNGSLVDNGNGTYTITPTANFNGAVTLSYNVIDGNGGSTAATQSFNLAAVNDAPALIGARATLANASEDTPYIVSLADLLQGYTDVDGDTLSVANLITTNGTIVNNNNSTYTITQIANFNGTATLIYDVIDGNGGIRKSSLNLEAIGRSSGTDQTPQITAVGSNGEYVVTFNGQDSGFGDQSIYVQKFNANGTPAGAMVQLEASGRTNGTDQTPQITAVGSNGEYVVTFTGQDSSFGDQSIYVQKFNANGTPAGAMVQLEASGRTNGTDQTPQITAVGSNGEYVVTFNGQDSSFGDQSIYVQKFNVNGTPAGEMVQLEASGRTDVTDQTPQITAVGSSGEYVVTFNGVDSAGDQSIFVQKFNANGTITGNTMVQLEATGRTDVTDQTPQITAVGSNGEYVVTFNGVDSAGDQSIFVQKFNANGTITGNTMVQLEASGRTDGTDQTPQITAVGSNGEYVVTFTGQDSSFGDQSIYVQKFNVNGTPAGEMVKLEAIGKTTSADITPQVTAVGSTGEYVVTFDGVDSAGDRSIFVQRFNANGTLAGDMVQLEATDNITGTDQTPQVTALGSSGEYIVTFSGFDSNISGFDTSIFVQKFNADGKLIGDLGVQRYIITAVNDAPVNTLPASYTTNEDTAVKLSGLSVADVDVGSGVITVNLAVASGTLTATTAGSVTVTGSGTNSVTLTGTLADINAYLANVTNQPTYIPEPNANGTVTLTMTTTDGGNTGSGGPLTDVDASTINITPVNDAPALTGTKATLVAGTEDTPYTVTLADLLQGYTDVDGNLSVTNLIASNGNVVNNGNNTFTITPTSNYNGPVTLSYNVVDGSGGIVSIVNNMVQLEALGNISGIDYQPQVTALGSSGEYVVTFTGQESGAISEISIFVQKFNADGTVAGNMVQLEAIGNTTGGDFYSQVTAVGSSGEYVVTFTGEDSGGDNSIFVQKFNANGTTAGNMVQLEAIGKTNGSDVMPQVTAVGNSGEYVVTFTGADSGGDNSIFVQKFNANGATAGNMVQLEAIGQPYASDEMPQVTAVGNSGEYVVTFSGVDSNGGYSIFVQKFNANGTTIGNMVKLEAISDIVYDDINPQVTAVGSNGEYVVTFEATDSAGDQSIFVQKFNANGTITGNTMVQLEATGRTDVTDQTPQITAVGSNGEYVVTFNGVDSAGDQSIFVQKFNANGTPAGAMVQLEASGRTNGTDQTPQITAVGSNGEYVVTFTGADSGFDYSIFVQKFNPNGTVAGSMVRLEAIGNTTGGDFYSQVTAVGNNGEYIVTFYGGDVTGDASVFVQKFNADGTIATNTMTQNFNLEAVVDVYTYDASASGNHTITNFDANSTNHDVIKLQDLFGDYVDAANHVDISALLDGSGTKVSVDTNNNVSNGYELMLTLPGVAVSDVTLGSDIILANLVNQNNNTL